MSEEDYSIVQDMNAFIMTSLEGSQNCCFHSSAKMTRPGVEAPQAKPRWDFLVDLFAKLDGQIEESKGRHRRVNIALLRVASFRRQEPCTQGGERSCWKYLDRRNCQASKK
jgi:hypothetical protein